MERSVGRYSGSGMEIEKREMAARKHEVEYSKGIGSEGRTDGPTIDQRVLREMIMVIWSKHIPYVQ